MRAALFAAMGALAACGGEGLTPVPYTTTRVAAPENVGSTVAHQHVVTRSTV